MADEDDPRKGLQTKTETSISREEILKRSDGDTPPAKSTDGED